MTLYVFRITASHRYLRAFSEVADALRFLRSKGWGQLYWDEDMEEPLEDEEVKRLAAEHDIDIRDVCLSCV